MHTDNTRPNHLSLSTKSISWQTKQFNPAVLTSCFILALCILSMPTQSFGLTLKQAETIATQSDPLVASHQASARALLDESVSKNTLPDPKFRLGLFNVPLDSLSTTQEGSTQLRLGIQQNFPRGDTLELQQQNSALLSQSASARAEDAQLKVLRNVRETFLNLYYEIQAGRIINDTSALFSKLVKITEAQYAAGRVKQQDVIRADLELSRLSDRSTRIKSKEDEYRADLAQWLGDSAWNTIDNTIPELSALPEIKDSNQILTNHPSVRVESSKVEASRKMIAVAKQGYKPGFNAFVEYRKRDGNNPNGSERDDMMAAMVTMDIPFFTESRQDKNVSANEEKSNAAKYLRDDKLRTLKRMLDKNRAIYKHLGKRELIYKNELLQSAKSNSAASLNSYQSGVTEFTTLMRARITELDVRLADLRIRVDRKRAQARLLYITGEQQ